MIEEKTKRELLYTYNRLIVGLPSEIIYNGKSILALSIGQYDHLVRAFETMRPLNFRYKDSLYSLIDINFDVVGYDKDKIQEKCQSFEDGVIDLDLSKFITNDEIRIRREEMEFIILVMGNIDILDE